ncbi:MAG: hypothetical protein ACR2RV_13465, partial [Verrucomicrobiales bacterium]
MDDHRPACLPIARLYRQFALALATLFVVSAAPLIAQDAEKPEPAAAVTADPDLSLDHLGLMLEPLTKGELLVEAEAWQELVKANVKQISDEEIATREKNEEIAEADAEPTISEAEE